MKTLLPLLLSLSVVGAFAADAAAPAPKTPVAPAPANATKSAVAPGTAAPAAATTGRAPAAAPAETFDSKFRLITDRNIFNANRTARRERSESAPAPRTDIIRLYGVMDSDK